MTEELNTPIHGSSQSTSMGRTSSTRPLVGTSTPAGLRTDRAISGRGSHSRSGTYASSPFTQVHPRPISTPGAWAPDGSRIALGQCVDMSYPCPQSDLILVNPNGGGEVNITNDAAADFNPDWQPIPINAYPRPAGAYPMRASLVPAYEPCISPNRTHGPPLALRVVQPAHPGSRPAHRRHPGLKRPGRQEPRLPARDHLDRATPPHLPTRPTYGCWPTSPTCGCARTSPTTPATWRPA